MDKPVKQWWNLQDKLSYKKNVALLQMLRLGTSQVQHLLVSSETSVTKQHIIFIEFVLHVVKSRYNCKVLKNLYMLWIAIIHTLWLKNIKQFFLTYSETFITLTEIKTVQTVANAALYCKKFSVFKEILQHHMQSTCCIVVNKMYL